ncbi:MAG TPA: RsmE family RNA methyltransferase [Gemmatimonadaceae bacterium]|nr:RsmE family RNA methyltransferase [Gemmatimonadaceae bacterium]
MGRPADLGENEVHHARVRRMTTGDPVRLIDGAGATAFGTLTRLTKTGASVELESVSYVAPPQPVHLLAPVADRDRMLWLAEKATELGLTSWRAVLWQRSRGVSPRGEGEVFRAKVRARMVAALTQSGGAWLPTILPDATADEVIQGAIPGVHFLLDVTGEPILSVPVSAPLTIAMGPEGGLEDDERERLALAGWMPVSLGVTTLRFETAGTAALAIARAAFAANVESARG